MSTMNNVTLIGRVVKDAEMQEYEGKVISARFTMACRRDYKNKEGKYDADFIECRILGEKRAPAGKMLKDGTCVSVVGSVTHDNYTNKEGKKIYITYIKVEAFGFLPGANTKKSDAPAKEKEMEEEFIPMTGDLPFN